ncbi:predicted protein [Plenodomus lingam JN3]|uniref:Predicted protein n=1 Tax=Leptosphaeria maculans (strain JN3 / isolate v23.1.3 / race Av1-4-5-6-7-8) TaxID=985895 RepID=E4ZUK2_LEPMJ|nr:predicted protein [Plenodomus lingam JN3]CBX95081.1 predicted protein [Plenodomus lingam JN3]
MNLPLLAGLICLPVLPASLIGRPAANPNTPAPTSRFSTHLPPPSHTLGCCGQGGLLGIPLTWATRCWLAQHLTQKWLGQLTTQYSAAAAAAAHGPDAATCIANTLLFRQQSYHRYPTGPRPHSLQPTKDKLSSLSLRDGPLGEAWCLPMNPTRPPTEPVLCDQNSTIMRYRPSSLTRVFIAKPNDMLRNENT